MKIKGQVVDLSSVAGGIMEIELTISELAEQLREQGIGGYIVEGKTAKPYNLNCESCLSEASCLLTNYYTNCGKTFSPKPEEKKEFSACCQMPVKVEGITTHYYSCTGCKRPCYLAEPQKECEHEGKVQKACEIEELDFADYDTQWSAINGVVNKINECIRRLNQL